MAKLWICNLSLQEHTFLYHVERGTREKPVNSSPRFATIPVGGQICIGDLNQTQIDWIIEQYRPYGLTNANELKNARNYHGYCYSIGEPIDTDVILGTVKKNGEVLNDQAKDMRELGAQALNKAVNDVAMETGSNVERTSTEITQQTGDNISIGEGYEATAPGVAPELGRGARRK